MAKCLECGNEFEAASVRAKFCSIPCKSSFHRKSIVSDTVSRIVSEDSIVSPITVSETPRTVSSERTVSEESDDDVGTLAAVVDLVKDLHLDLGRDLGCTAWTADGIFIRDDIQIEQVRSIRRVVEARHGWPHREYDGPNAPYSTAKLASVGV
jgi:hypothetical protein